MRYQKGNMKTFVSILTLNALLFAALSANAQGTAFTYQGRLNDSGNPASGSYDLRFILYDNDIGGSQLGPIRTNSATPVANGLFTITLDFGSVFNGGARWLEISVRTNGNASFTPLVPRQNIAPAPYSITAINLSGPLPASQLSGSLPAAQLSGTYTGVLTLNNAANSFTGNGAGLSNLNAATVGGVAATNLWRLTGNAGTTGGATFLGTTDNQPLELRVNNVRALRIEPNSRGLATIIGGSTDNSVSAGASAAGFIGSGNSNLIQSISSAIVAGLQNTIEPNAPHSAIGGGQFNRINNNANRSAIVGGDGNIIQTNAAGSFIGGGFGNVIQTNATNSVIAGGVNNLVRIFGTNGVGTIGGGKSNTVNGDFATIGGGTENLASGRYATVAGGYRNFASGLQSTICGGGAYYYGNYASGDYSFIGGGSDNYALETSSAVVGGYGNQAEGFYSVIGGGYYQIAFGYGSFIGGGSSQFAGGLYSFIGGGSDNGTTTNADYAVVGGGSFNHATGTNSTVGGGNDCQASGDYSAVPGGKLNSASGNYSFAAGRRAKADDRGSFVWADGYDFDFHSFTSNQFSVRCTGGAKFVTAIDGTGAQTAGVRLQAGDTAWSSISDRNAKKNFQPVNGEAVLEKLAAIPMQSWNYKWEADTNTPHLGPMAQDFKGAFFPGRDDQTISTLEFDGVELAAIQGLNQKLKEKDAEIQQLKESVAELKSLVSRLIPSAAK